MRGLDPRIHLLAKMMDCRVASLSLSSGGASRRPVGGGPAMTD
jgi:hypothetical protein